MARGGKRENAGRKPGSGNKMSAAARKAAAETGLLPHEFLLNVMRGRAVMLPDPKSDRRRIKRIPTFEEMLDAAKAAAPYYAPRLSAVALKAKTSENPWNELLEMVDGKSRGLPGDHAPKGG